MNKVILHGAYRAERWVLLKETSNGKFVVRNPMLSGLHSGGGSREPQVPPG